MQQGSNEWFQARCGYATASRFKDIMAKGLGKVRASYFRQLVAERITGTPKETYTNAHMLRGIEQEPFAKIAYIAKTGRNIEDAGFIKHPVIMAGASPDGFVGEDGGIEVKCVIPEVHLDTIKGNSCPSEHIPQIQGAMWITARKWWDFVSYCEVMPEWLRLYVHRVYRDDEFIMGLEKEVMKFLDEVNAEVETIMERKP